MLQYVTVCYSTHSLLSSMLSLEPSNNSCQISCPNTTVSPLGRLFWVPLLPFIRESEIGTVHPCLNKANPKNSLTTTNDTSLGARQSATPRSAMIDDWSLIAWNITHPRKQAIKMFERDGFAWNNSRTGRLRRALSRRPSHVQAAWRQIRASTACAVRPWPA